MCFSAEASFTFSAVLLVAGAASLKKETAPAQLVFASIPLFFSVQQFSEGVLWIALTDPVYASWQGPATYLFLTFAQAVWPAWVPLSFLLLEKNLKRKRLLYILFGMGAVVSFYLAFCLYHYEVSSRIVNHHIYYHLEFPGDLLWVARVFYFLPTVFPPFISSVKKASLLGSLILGSYLVSLVFFQDVLISVWCFLAAGISVVIWVMMRDAEKE